MSGGKKTFRYLAKDDGTQHSDDAWVIDRKLVKEYLQTLKEKEYSPITLRSYEKNLNRMTERFPEQDPLKRGSLDLWYQELVDSGLAAASAQTHIIAANSFLEYCGLREFQSFRRYDKRRKEWPALTREEYRRLLQAAKMLGKERDYMLIKLFALTGAERAVMKTLTVEALEENKITYSARGVEKELRLSEALRQELLDYARRSGIFTGPIFLSDESTPLNDHAATKSIRRLAEAAQVPTDKANPTCLQKLYRSTRAALEKDLDRLVAQEMERRVDDEQAMIGWSG